MAGRPLRPATDRCFGRPLPCQLANQTRGHPIPPEFFTLYHAVPCAYAVLTVVSNWYPPEWGRFPTRYSPVRHSVCTASIRKLPQYSLVRLACVKHAASVHPEPGSNSRKKFDQGSELSADFSLSLFSLILKVSSLNKTFKNLQGCFTVQLSKNSAAFRATRLIYH